MCGSCHGMLCVAIEQSSPILWNPSTGKLETLPCIQPPQVAYGFGYDHVSSIYKLVAFYSGSSDHGGYGTDVKVHTLGTDSWRAIPSLPDCVSSDSSGKFLSGRLNWLAMNIPRRCSVIVSLDLGTEMYHELSTPLVSEEGTDFTYFTSGVSKGCLCVLSHCRMASDVWLMKDYGNNESWIKLVSLPYLSDNTSMDIHIIPLCVSDKDGGEILFESRGRLVAYNFENRTYYNTPPGIPEFSRQIVADIYSESLISPCP